MTDKMIGIVTTSLQLKIAKIMILMLRTSIALVLAVDLVLKSQDKKLTRPTIITIIMAHTNLLKDQLLHPTGKEYAQLPLPGRGEQPVQTE